MLRKLSDSDAKIITDKLTERDATGAICHVCKGNSFSFADGITMLTLSKDRQEANNAMSPKILLPCCLLVCDNCGSINLHALGPLELENHFESRP